MSSPGLAEQKTGPTGVKGKGYIKGKGKTKKGKKDEVGCHNVMSIILTKTVNASKQSGLKRKDNAKNTGGDVKKSEKTNADAHGNHLDGA